MLHEELTRDREIESPLLYTPVSSSCGPCWCRKIGLVRSGKSGRVNGLARRDAKSAGLVAKKKAIYFRRIEQETRAPGLKYFQVLHGYCNFKFYSAHEHAKYLGFVAGFADGHIFRELVDERGVSDIWLSDEMLREDLCRFPALARYTKRFRVLP